jgi:hypothetical protein
MESLIVLVVYLLGLSLTWGIGKELAKAKRVRMDALTLTWVSWGWPISLPCLVVAKIAGLATRKMLAK